MFRRWLAVAAAGAAFFFAGPAAGEVPVPPLKARVTDLTGTLTAQQIQTLEGRLRDFERGKGSQIAVLILPSTQPETIEQYSIRVADAWKIGRTKADDGVILVVAKNDRKLRIEVGRGLEGAIPDAIAKRVVSDVIAPHFRANDFYGGIAAGADALAKLIEGETLPPPERRAGPNKSSPDYQSLLVMLLVLAIIGGGFLSRILGRGVGAAGTGALAGLVTWAAGAAVGRADGGPAEEASAASAAAAGASAAAEHREAGERTVNCKRLLRHLFTDHWSVRRAFPPAAMRAIEKTIGEEEQRHAGQMRFAVEASLPFGELLREVKSRERAVDWFGRLRVWDTEHNSGVLIYLLLADRSVEIVADRGVHSKVGRTAWEAICGEMQQEFARGQFERGVVIGVRAISDLLAAHYPAQEGGKPNELPDKPVVL